MACVLLGYTSVMRPVFPPSLPPHANNISCILSRFFLNLHLLGSDGTISIWDKDARTRMKSKPPPLSLLECHSLAPSLVPFLALPPVRSSPSSLKSTSPPLHTHVYSHPTSVRRGPKSDHQFIVQPHRDDIRVRGCV